MKRRRAIGAIADSADDDMIFSAVSEVSRSLVGDGGIEALDECIGMDDFAERKRLWRLAAAHQRAMCVDAARAICDFESHGQGGQAEHAVWQRASPLAL